MRSGFEITSGHAICVSPPQLTCFQREAKPFLKISSPKNDDKRTCHPETSRFSSGSNDHNRVIFLLLRHSQVATRNIFDKNNFFPGYGFPFQSFALEESLNMS